MDKFHPVSALRLSNKKGCTSFHGKWFRELYMKSRDSNYKAATESGIDRTLISVK